MATIPDTSPASLPPTISASQLLTQLPPQHTTALHAAENPTPTKVTLKFKPLISAPPLPKETYKIKSTQRFENVHKFLRDQLGLGEGVGLYTYVGFSFAPALDEGVGGLWKSFQVGGVLVVGYALQSAFG